MNKTRKMNAFDTNTSLYHAVALQEKFNTVSDAFVIEQIKSLSNSLAVRVAILQLSEERKDNLVFIDLYYEIVDGRNGYPNDLRQNALWMLPKDTKPTTLSAAVRTRIRSYTDLTDNQKSNLLKKCKYIICNTSDNDLKDMVALSLSDSKDIDAIEIVLEISGSNQEEHKGTLITPLRQATDYMYRVSTVKP